VRITIVSARLHLIAYMMPVLALSGCSGGSVATPLNGPPLVSSRLAAKFEQPSGCTNTGGTGLDIEPAGDRQRVNWREAEDPAFGLKQLFIFGANDNPGTADFQIENSTCDVYFNAPPPPRGTVVFYTGTYTACIQSCPAQITFTDRDHHRMAFSSRLLSATGTYVVFFYANQMQTPTAVLRAKTFGREHRARITFETPFRTPLVLQTAYGFIFETVETKSPP
jgi:hypothetical protein